MNVAEADFKPDGLIADDTDQDFIEDITVETAVIPQNRVLDLQTTTSLLLPLAPALSTFSGLSSTEHTLLSYFIFSMGPSCSLSSTRNPYLHYLTPMSFEFPVLKNALLAASANQLRLLNDKRFEMEAWWYKEKAIQGVQNAIDTGNVDIGTVGSVLMLCFYDVCIILLGLTNPTC